MIDIFNNEKISKLESTIRKLEEKLIDIQKRPSDKWGYRFRKVRPNPYIPTWYKCRYCETEYQTSPPSGSATGRPEDIESCCPECTVAIVAYELEKKEKRGKNESIGSL